MILNKIQGHPIFGPQQAAVHYQLHVALHRFRSSIDTMQVEQMFEIENSTVLLYIYHICTILMSL